jgi:DNA-binding NarL/FixJ family response regulator
VITVFRPRARRGIRRTNEAIRHGAVAASPLANGDDEVDAILLANDPRTICCVLRCIDSARTKIDPPEGMSRRGTRRWNRKQNMRALWIEDHGLIGDSLGLLLGVVMPEISLDKAREWRTAEPLFAAIPYELVLLDWWLGDEDAEAVIDRIDALRPGIPFIVVSGDDRAGVRERALVRGASKFVSKSADPAELVDAIRQAIGSVRQSQGQIDGAKGPDQPARPVLAPVDVSQAIPELTERQCDVFRGLLRGWADKQIARDLGISETTVKTHVRAILSHLGVRRRGEAAHLARARGADVR